MIEWLIALITLTFLEIVLGIDNIIFISIMPAVLGFLKQRLKTGSTDMTGKNNGR